jgi:hypothetical protein
MSINDGSISFAVSVIDESRRLVFGEVYAPNKIDAFGWFMEPTEVEKMAHRFMKLDLSTCIDTNHDNVPNGSYPVQSFIAREGDPQFTPGAWVLGVKVTNETLWNAIVKGEINAFSMEIYVKKVPATVQYEVVGKQVGMTEPAGDDQHTHYFYAEVDTSGRVVKGKTSTNAGHYHEIDVNSVTQATNNHAHRFFVGK